MVQDSAQAAKRLSQQSVRLNQHVVRFVIDGNSTDRRSRDERDDARADRSAHLEQTESAWA